MTGERVYIDDDGKVADLHDAYVCRNCEYIYQWSDTPTELTACNVCEQAAGWEYVQ